MENRFSPVRRKELRKFGVARPEISRYLGFVNVVLLTMAVFFITVLAMATGVILTSGKKQLQGSCGGPAFNAACCMTCPDKDGCDDEKISNQTDEKLVEIGGSNSSC